jgi:hypothetical protein
MTEPYYSDGLVTLYHADCRDVPPSGSLRASSTSARWQQ